MNVWTRATWGLAIGVVAFAAVACGQKPDLPTPPASDARAGGIDGTVSNHEGEPVVGVRLGIVSGTVPFPELGPSTDDQGFYRFGSIPAGTFQVAVHDAQGERIAFESVEVRAGETSRLDFTVAASADTVEQPALPRLPIIQLNYEGQVFNGIQGSYCWPVARSNQGSLTGLCEDDLRFQALVDTISVTAGDTIAVQIDADEPPERLTASIYETESQSRVSTAALGDEISPSFKIDLPAGVYNVLLQGSWEEWSVEYEFRIEAVALVSRLPSAEPMAGSCLPAAQLAVSRGATWTISGRANIPAVFPGGLPEGTSEMSTTFVVTGFGTESSAGGTSGATAEHPTVELIVKTVARDEDGTVLSADDGVLTRSPVSVVGNISPVLTLDWDWFILE